MAATAALTLAGGNADAEGQLARLEGLQTAVRLEGLFQDQFRGLGGHLFNLHAAGRRGHEHRLALHAVEHDAEIQLALDGQRLFDQEALHHAALGAGLVGDQLHADHAAGDFGGFGGVLGDFDASAFAAAAGVNLRLHDHAAADAPWRRFPPLPR